MKTISRQIRHFSRAEKILTWCVIVWAGVLFGLIVGSAILALINALGWQKL